MKIDFKDVAVLTAAGMIGNYFAEMYLLEPADGSGGGFIPVNDGLGLDDVARAASIALAATALGKVF